MRVEFSEEAERDLDEILEMIWHRDGVQPALNFIEKLRAFCLSLSKNPHIGTRLPDIGEEARRVGYRRQATLHFQIFEGKVVIDRILYGGKMF